MIKLIHTGDLHLGMEFKNAGFDINQAHKRRRELWDTFYRIVDRARDTKVDLLLIAGDLFEEDYCSVGDMKRIAAKLGEIRDVKVIITTGNHDPLGNKSLYRLVKWPENVYIFDTGRISKIEFDTINTAVWGLSWDKKEERKGLVDDIAIDDPNKINILLVHGDILSNDSEYLPINREAIINKGFDYVALGHIHKHQFVDSKVAYCGSPEPLDFGEKDLHGIIEGNISKSEATIEFLPFSKRIFIVNEITITEELSYDEIIKIIEESDIEDRKRQNLYRIILKGIRDRDIRLDINDIKEVLKRSFYYIEIIDDTIPDYDLERIKKDNADNIIGYFIEEMEKKGLDDPIIKDSLYCGLEALLTEKVRR